MTYALMSLLLFLGLVVWLELKQKKTYRQPYQLDPLAIRRLVAGQAQLKERFTLSREQGKCKIS